MAGYIKFYRDIQEHWIYKDNDYLKVWVEMLFCARYLKEPKTDTYKKILYTLNYGDFIFGYPSWSERLNIGQQKLRTLILKMIVDGMIVLIKKHSKFTLYNIVNYEKFNKQTNNLQDLDNIILEETTNKQTNKQVTSRQQADNKQTTTKKKDKKDKKERSKDKTAIEIAIYDFQEFRKKIRKPMTDRAVELLIINLNKLASDDETKIAILNQSILNSWQGVFAIKEDDKKNSKNWK